MGRSGGDGNADVHHRGCPSCTRRDSAVHAEGMRPMRHQIRLFVTTEGCRHEEATIELMRAAGVPLDELYERRRIAGYQLSVITTEDDYEEKDLDRQLIERETQRRLP